MRSALLLTALLLLLVPGAGAVPQAPDVQFREVVRLTDPVAARAPVEVAARIEGNVSSVSLYACEWDTAAKNASYCLAPEPLARGADGLWRGTSPLGFPGGSTAGFKLVARNATGAEAKYPTDQEYVLFTVQPDAREAPAPAAPLLLALLAAAALVLARHRPRAP